MGRPTPRLTFFFTSFSFSLIHPISEMVVMPIFAVPKPLGLWVTVDYSEFYGGRAEKQVTGDGTHGGSLRASYREGGDRFR